MFTSAVLAVSESIWGRGTWKSEDEYRVDEMGDTGWFEGTAGPTLKNVSKTRLFLFIRVNTYGAFRWERG